MSAPQLGPGDLAIAASLLTLPALASAWWRLGLLKPLLISAARMGLQLLLAGWLLTHLLALDSPVWVLAVLLAMLLFAAREAVARQKLPFAGAWSLAIALAATAATLVLTLGTALFTHLRPDPWFEARVLIPLGGMILGNVLTAVALATHSLNELAVREARSIEARLALGASFSEAIAPITRRTLTQALMPTINSMAATGLVFLPGMMTGQILAGVEPMLAVRYRLLIMFLLAGGATCAALIAVRMGAWRLSDERGRLRLDHLRRDSTPRR